VSDASRASGGPARPSTRPGLDVVEILGFGRSGSTLLDRLLADALGVPGFGELVAVWRRGLLEDRHCSCGERFGECPFWRDVVATDPGVITRRRAAEVVLLTNRVMQVWSPLRVSSAPARRALVDAVPASWFEAMGALYRGVAGVAETSTFVDSSKAPVLGLLLAQVPGIRVRPVPLVRDPRAVAWAWGHPGAPVPLAPALPGLSPARAAVVWSLVLHATEVVARVLGDGTDLVRYEDLVAAPEATVAQIVQALALDLPASTGSSRAAHTMSGNPRLRFVTAPPVVREDQRWRQDTSSSTWAAVTALTLPGVLRHGYPVRPSHPHGSADG